VLPFDFIQPSEGATVPILISVPHCGTKFPEELHDEYKQELILAPDDTDWFVDQLYDFTPGLGMTMITATYSRWVIDLNRHPKSKPLYTDGRIITGLCPTTDFLGNPIYKDNRTEIDHVEIQRRLDRYFSPYHEQIQRTLDAILYKFGVALLWDCHSIRQSVPTIQQAKFPDLILGSADGASASNRIIDKAIEGLRDRGYSFQHNHPFKGGYITRHYGKPDRNVNALQLEMSKVNYMDDDELKYDKHRAEKIRKVLRATLLSLAEILS
jgi:N-formylglutamate deformylase